MKKVSMQTIADQLNVTKVTVSKALNNKEGISAETRKKVLELAADLGYNLKNGKSVSGEYNFAFVVLSRFFEKIGENFYTRIYFYLNHLCLQNDSKLNLIIISEEEYNEGRIPKAIDKGIDGVFFCGEFKDDYIKKIIDIVKNVVAIDFEPRNIKIDCVVSNNYELGFEATNYLIERGHKTIGFVGSPQKSLSVCDRFYGYQRALFLNHLPFSDELLVINESIIDDTFATDIVLPKCKPTAYVCNCDAAAYHFAQVLKTKGYSVGEDVSLISFDNTEIADMMHPKLSTFNIDKQLFAERAFKLIIKRVKSNSNQYVKQYSVFNLIKRESVKKLI